MATKSGRPSALTCVVLDMWAPPDAPGGVGALLPGEQARELKPDMGYFTRCTDQDGKVVNLSGDPYTPERFWQNTPGADPLAGLPEVEIVGAVRAAAEASVPRPTVRLAPREVQLVGLATWFWISEGWARSTATAQLAEPGVTATITVVPRTDPGAMVFDPKVSGSTPVACTPPGIEWNGQKDDGATDCRYTFEHLVEPGHTATLTVLYDLEWAVTAGPEPYAGLGGTIPRLSATVDVPIQTKATQAVGR